MRLKGKNFSRRGATLVELTVVMAVVAIISTMVVSFIILINARVDATTKKVNLNQDVIVVEGAIEHWANELINENATFNVDGTATIGENNFHASISDGVLVLELPSGNLTYSVSVIKEISIRIETPQTNPFFICYAYYFSDNHSINAITFTVYPFVGTTIGG